MTKVDARECQRPDCGALVRAEEAVEVEVKYKGAINGRYKLDYCQPCAEAEVPDGVTFIPKSSGGSTSDEAQPSL